MTITRIDAVTLTEMLEKGSEYLAAQSSVINALNVFPVPDGDTGTNMSLTMQSGVKQLKESNPETIGEAMAFFSKGLLMGARGNSGVILSQLFRGMSKTLENVSVMDGKNLADALQSGVETAYKAVMKPVEGTILTVAKEAAKAAIKKAKKTESIIDLLVTVYTEANRALQKTPTLLPLLKEAGVVDSGGQGLVTIYEGFLTALKGEALIHSKHNYQDVGIQDTTQHNAHSIIKTEDIHYGFCTEFIVRFNEAGKKGFDGQAFKERLSRDGDSLLVANDDELLKVHIHTEKPGDMLTLAQTFGELIKIKVENMREQHRNLVKSENKEAVLDKSSQIVEHQPVGIVTVAAGRGIEALFKSMGATIVLQGGQTMNPSTEDLLKAINDTNSEKVLLLPNNSNIIMAAKQAAEVSDIPVSIVETQTIPQGLSALLTFNPEASLDDNNQVMSEAIQHVKSGQITHAVRDTMVDGLEVTKGHYIGIYEKKIVVSHPERCEALEKLLDAMIDDNDEILTLITGDVIKGDEAEGIREIIQNKYEQIEVEIHEGDQPVYDYFIAVE